MKPPAWCERGGSADFFSGEGEEGAGAGGRGSFTVATMQ